jgi:hypothetical protein
VPNPNAPSSEDAEVIDYASLSAFASGQPVDGGDGKPPKRVQDERPTSTSSLPGNLLKPERSADFTHPATAEQRIIWLPKDGLGLVHEIERDLEAHDILHSSKNAEMDDKGRVEVTMTIPEDVQHSSEGSKA